MFAVIEAKGKQYKVSEGQIVLIDLMDEPTDKNVVFDNVLLINSDDKVLIGQPTVKGATVEGELICTEKGKKVVVFKMKRRKSSMKKTGHRQQYSKIRITKINTSSKKTIVETPKAETSDIDTL